MHTEIYCKTLDAMDRAKAARAIHAAWLQLSAAGAGVENLDNSETLDRLAACLRDAGHPGFFPEGPGQ